MKNAIRYVSVALIGLASVAGAQSVPPVRPLGPPLAISTEPFAAVSQVRSLPGGRLLLHDNAGRRVVLLDSTLKLLSVVADTTVATKDAYGPTMSGLIEARGDSTLIVNIDFLSMLVIDPNGNIARIAAVPDPKEAGNLLGGPFGTPGVDPQGRLVYEARLGGMGRIGYTQVPGGPPPPPDKPDSALVVRFNVARRKVDTVGKFLIPSVVRHTVQDENKWVTTTYMINPLPWTDDWALLSDGRVAIVHGQEYRVDFVDPTGEVTTSPKILFDWQRLNDSAKTAIIDSARKTYNTVNAARLAADAANAKADSARMGSAPMTATRATAASASGGRAAFHTSVRVYIPIDEMPDYRPAFVQAAARGDEDGNLWIRTSKFVNGGAVYDVINRQGTLIARVQVPQGRVIAGFGPGGIVYTGFLDGAIARVERAQFSQP
jgi:hypothetical protein